MEASLLGYSTLALWNFSRPKDPGFLPSMLPSFSSFPPTFSYYAPLPGLFYPWFCPLHNIPSSFGLVWLLHNPLFLYVVQPFLLHYLLVCNTLNLKVASFSEISVTNCHSAWCDAQKTNFKQQYCENLMSCNGIYGFSFFPCMPHIYLISLHYIFCNIFFSP